MLFALFQYSFGTGKTRMNKVEPLHYLKNRHFVKRYHSKMSKLYRNSAVLSLPVFIFGLVARMPSFVAIANLLFSALFIISSFVRFKERGVTIIFAYTFAAFLATFSNLVVYVSMNERFLYYAKPQYFFEASVIQYLGVLGIVGGFMVSQTSRGRLSAIHLDLKAIGGARGLIILTIFLMILTNSTNLGFLGALRPFIAFLPQAVVFILARLGSRYNNRRILLWALALAALLTLLAILNSYLRKDMILPFVAFSLGILIGDYKRFLKPRFLIPAVLFFTIFLQFFSFWGDNRTKLGSGFTRIEAFQSYREEEEAQDKPSDEGGVIDFIARIGNVNQLTSIVSLQKAEGFYKGGTLEYLGFAFIPRLLWPGKPIIQKGAWFAEKIGQGYQDRSGKYNNSINMTIQGELFLNFGWWGVIMGSILFGFLIGLLWKSCALHQEMHNVAGNAFGYYLLFLGFFSLGADLQIIVTLIAIYLLFLFTSKVSHIFS